MLKKCKDKILKVDFNKVIKKFYLTQTPNYY